MADELGGNVKELFLSFLMLATQHRSYTYGFSEFGCGKSRCIEGVSVTASGDILSKQIPSVAVPLPKHIPLQVMWIGLKTETGKCTRVKVNDRTSVRLAGKRGFDLSPAALFAITGKVSSTWSGRLFLCDVELK
jgi:hypothetical protein